MFEEVSECRRLFPHRASPCFEDREVAESIKDVLIAGGQLVCVSKAVVCVFSQFASERGHGEISFSGPQVIMVWGFWEAFYDAPP